jgi:hypothetical protein
MLGCIIGKLMLIKIVFYLDDDSNWDCILWNGMLIYEWWTGNSVGGSCCGIIKLLYRGWPRHVSTPCSYLASVSLSVALLLQWRDWGSPQKTPVVIASDPFKTWTIIQHATSGVLLPYLHIQLIDELLIHIFYLLFGAELIWYMMIYMLTAIDLTPGGSSTVHIYTQKTQWNRRPTTEHT